jgi:uncharacterized membrane-anchored protein YhcB (DUF1043 family)
VSFNTPTIKPQQVSLANPLDQQGLAKQLVDPQRQDQQSFFADDGALAKQTGTGYQAVGQKLSDYEQPYFNNLNQREQQSNANYANQRQTLKDTLNNPYGTPDPTNGVFASLGQRGTGRGSFAALAAGQAAGARSAQQGALLNQINQNQNAMNNQYGEQQRSAINKFGENRSSLEDQYQKQLLQNAYNKYQSGQQLNQQELALINSLTARQDSNNYFNAQERANADRANAALQGNSIWSSLAGIAGNVFLGATKSVVGDIFGGGKSSGGSSSSVSTELPEFTSANGYNPTDLNQYNGGGLSSGVSPQSGQYSNPFYVSNSFLTPGRINDYSQLTRGNDFPNFDQPNITLPSPGDDQYYDYA